MFLSKNWVLTSKPPSKVSHNATSIGKLDKEYFIVKGTTEKDFDKIPLKPSKLLTANFEHKVLRCANKRLKEPKPHT